jgi:hypothetical protein
MHILPLPGGSLFRPQPLTAYEWRLFNQVLQRRTHVLFASGGEHLGISHG